VRKVLVLTARCRGAIGAGGLELARRTVVISVIGGRKGCSQSDLSESFAEKRGGRRGEAPTQSGRNKWFSLASRWEFSSDATLERRDRRSWVCSLGVILPWWSSAPLPGGGIELCLCAFVCGVVSLRLVMYQCFFFLNDLIKKKSKTPAWEEFFVGYQNLKATQMNLIS
jgi:hypothetical protein